MGAASGCLQAPPPLNPEEGDASGEGATVTVLWEGRGPGDLYAIGEVRGFEIRQGDRVLGYSWGRYLGTEGEGPSLRHRFETRTELLLPGREPAHAAGLLVLDAAGNLLNGYERSSAAQLRFTRDKELLRLTDGTREDEVLYEPEKRPTAFMAHSAFFQEELMLGLRTLVEGELAWRLVSLSGGAPVEWEAEVLRSPKRTGGQTVIRTSLGEEITLEDGRMLRNEVSASQLVVKAMEGTVEWPTWTVVEPEVLRYEPQPAASFERRALELPGREGEPALFGELLIPAGVKPPAAAVLWVSGTGREDRHGFAGPPSVDLGSHEITDALAQAGLLVLRFDERGRGSSEAGPLTFTAQLEDVRRAYRTLLVQPEVDPDRVVLVAHGEGGLRALSLAAQEGKSIAGLALLGSPGRPYLEVLRHQGAAALQQVPPKLRDQARKYQQQMLDGLAEGKVPPELEDQAGWLQETLELDPAKMMAKVQAPVWLAQGDKDFEVDPQRDSAALLAAAKARGKKSPASLSHYPMLDHLFKVEPERSSPARYREPGRGVDEQFIADLSAWVVKTVKPTSAKKRTR